MLPARVEHHERDLVHHVEERLRVAEGSHDLQQEPVGYNDLRLRVPVEVGGN